MISLMQQIATDGPTLQKSRWPMSDQWPIKPTIGPNEEWPAGWMAGH